MLNQSFAAIEAILGQVRPVDQSRRTWVGCQKYPPLGACHDKLDGRVLLRIGLSCSRSGAGRGRPVRRGPSDPLWFWDWRRNQNVGARPGGNRLNASACEHLTKCVFYGRRTADRVRSAFGQGRIWNPEADPRLFAEGNHRFADSASRHVKALPLSGLASRAQ